MSYSCWSIRIRQGCYAKVTGPQTKFCCCYKITFWVDTHACSLTVLVEWYPFSWILGWKKIILAKNIDFMLWLMHFSCCLENSETFFIEDQKIHLASRSSSLILVFFLFLNTLPKDLKEMANKKYPNWFMEAIRKITTIFNKSKLSFSDIKEW